MNVEWAMQNVRMATPKTMDELGSQLANTLVAELPKCGAQAEKLKREAEGQLQQSQQRCEQIKEQRAKEEAMRKEQEEKARQLQTQLSEMVQKAEEDSTKLKDAASPAVAEGAVLGTEEAKDTAIAVAEAGASAKAACKACTELIVTNRQALEGSSATVAAAKDLSAELREGLLKLQGRLQETLKLIISSTMSSKVACEKAVKKAKAMEALDKRAAVFQKYDKRKKGHLDKAEVVAYAKGEFCLALSAEAAARIAGRLTPEGAAGVPKAALQDLRKAVGIAAEEEAARQRLKAAEEKRTAMEAKKSALMSDVEKLAERLGEAEEEIKKAEELSKPLQPTGLATVERGSIAEISEEASGQLSTAQSEVAEAREKIAELLVDVEEELKPLAKLESRKLEVKADTFDIRLRAVALTLRKARSHAAKLEAAEYDALRAQVAGVLRESVAEKKLTLDTFFAEVDKDSDGAVSQAEFLAHCKSCEKCKVEEDKLEQLFASFDEEGKGSIGKDAFRRLTNVYYHVVRDTAMTTDVGIKDGQTVRRLDSEEVIETVEGPVRDDEVGITRVKGRAAKDGVEGWVTIVGNGGSTFLQEGGCTYEALADTVLTADFEQSATDAEGANALSAGDLVEVVEWDRKDESTGMARLRVKAKGKDGKVGWVAKAGLKLVPMATNTNGS
jgi:Ca2+-binding EF-hand superfamily protein